MPAAAGADAAQTFDEDTGMLSRPQRALLLGIALSVSACAPQFERNPLPPGQDGRAYAIAGSGDRSGLAIRSAPGPAIAFSGGGQKGAFGAGVMVGWTARGDRPEFAVVTGVSTGAILALFTFLGPQYDDVLENLYTRYSTRDLVRRNLVAGLLGGTSLDNAAPYRKLIDAQISDRIVAEIATEAERGRKLLIGSTDLDARRPYLWDVTAIAASGHPDRTRLIGDIIQASSAIPAVFPPVFVPFVDQGGTRYDRMHVDGGVTRLFEYGPMLGSAGNRRAPIYIVVNEFLSPQFREVRDQLSGIAEAAVETAILYSTREELLVFADTARLAGLGWQGTAIPATFTRIPKETFDPAYMRALFELGRDRGASGSAWMLGPRSMDALR